MNKNIQILIAIIASMFLITTACNRDEAEEFPIADKDSFSINISFGKLSTRALSTEDGDEDGAFNENKINSLDIFFYEGSTLKWKVNSLTYDEASKKATIPISADKR
ncbi:MAG: fimbrial protein, partial [Bacteroidales bacterium]